MPRDLKPSGLQAQVREERRETISTAKTVKQLKEAPRPKIGFIGGSRRRKATKGIVYTGSAPEFGRHARFVQTPEWQEKEAKAKAEYESAKAIAEQVLENPSEYDVVVVKEAESLLNKELSVRHSFAIVQAKRGRYKGRTDETGAEVLTRVGGVGGLKDPRPTSVVAREVAIKKQQKYDELIARKKAIEEIKLPEGTKVARQFIIPGVSAVAIPSIPKEKKIDISDWTLTPVPTEKKDKKPEIVAPPSEITGITDYQLDSKPIEIKEYTEQPPLTVETTPSLKPFFSRGLLGIGFEEKESKKWFKHQISKVGRWVEQKTQSAEKEDIITPLGTQVLGGAAGALLGVGYLFRYPIESAKDVGKGISSIIKDPKIVRDIGADIGRDIYTYPGKVVGETAVFAYSPKIIKEIIKIGKKTYQRTPWTKKAKQFVPSDELLKEADKISRQRATLLLQDEQGNYIFGMGKSKRQAISIGGKIEKGQTPKTAALAELAEETGLAAQDIKKLKYKGKVVTPEETHHVYTAIVKKEVMGANWNKWESGQTRIGKMEAMSDASGGFVKVKPSEARGITGQTYVNPVSKKGVRTYDLGIINWLETGAKPTWLYTETSEGVVILATQSRYDVKTAAAKQLGLQEELFLAHGSPERILGMIKTELKINPGKSVRKQEVSGVFFQPPVTSKKIPFGFEESFIRNQQEIFLKKRVPKFDLGIPSTWKWKLKGRKPGTFYEFTTGEQPGYLGISYLGIDKADPEAVLGFKFGWKRPTAVLVKEAPKDPFKFSKKALTGKELEIILTEGILKKKSTSKPTAVWFGGERVRFQPAELVKIAPDQKRLLKELADTDVPISKRRAAAKQLKLETGIEYGQYKYIGPEELTRLRYKPKPEKYDIAKGYQPKKQKYAPKISYQPKTAPYKPIAGYQPPGAGYSPGAGYQPPGAGYSPGAGYQPPVPPYTPGTGILLTKHKKTAQPGYHAHAREIVRQKGKVVEKGYTRLNKQPLTKNDALSMGMRAVDQTVARTFKISKANKQAKGASTDYYWNANKYKVRPPIRKGRFVPKTNIYIEKSKYAIDTPGEHRGITVKGWKVRQVNKRRLF